jgi:polar amino acid transport system substrate-binding protein
LNFPPGDHNLSLAGPEFANAWRPEHTETQSGCYGGCAVQRMRSLFPKALSVVCLLVSVAAMASGPNERPQIPDPVKIVSGPHYPPFSSRGLPQNGLGPFLVSKIFEASGVSVSSDFRPWKRAYRETLIRKHDSALPYTQTPKRRSSFLFSEPVFKVRSYIFVRSASDINAESLSELHNRKYCNPLGFSDGAPIERLESRGHLTRLSPSTLENCFKMLVAGRVDFIKTNPHVAEYMIGNFGISPETVRALPFVVETEYLHVIVARNHPNGGALIDAFNQTHKRMKAEGQLKSLTKRYLDRVNAAGKFPISVLE